MFALGFPGFEVELTQAQSQALLNAIKDYENNKWKVIGQKVGKPAKVCQCTIALSAAVILIPQPKQACEQYAKEHFPGMMN